jgi:hypothetical protein
MFWKDAVGHVSDTAGNTRIMLGHGGGGGDRWSGDADVDVDAAAVAAAAAAVVVVVPGGLLHDCSSMVCTRCAPVPSGDSLQGAESASQYWVDWPRLYACPCCPFSAAVSSQLV